MATAKIVISPAEFGLDEAKGKEIESVFLPVITERDNLLVEYDEIASSAISEPITKKARELRLKLVKVRTNTEKVHKSAKAFYLAGGKFVDAWKNRNTTSIELMEAALLSIENHYVNIELKRVADLKAERIKLLSDVCDHPEIFVVELMTEEAFDDLLASEYAAKKARIKAAELAETKRLADIEAEKAEQKRILDENAALRAENKLKEDQLLAEKEKLGKLIKAQESHAAMIESPSAPSPEISVQTNYNGGRIPASLKSQVLLWVYSLEKPNIEQDNEAVRFIMSKFESFKSWAIAQTENI